MIGNDILDGDLAADGRFFLSVGRSLGYEVPFTRLFYKFVAPVPSNEVFEEIKSLEAEETELMKELFGNA